MSAVITDIQGLPAFVGSAAPVTRWSADASFASPVRHQLAAIRKPMTSTYEVKTVNGNDRRPSRGST